MFGSMEESLDVGVEFRSVFEQTVRGALWFERQSPYHIDIDPLVACQCKQCIAMQRLLEPLQELSAEKLTGIWRQEH